MIDYRGLQALAMVIEHGGFERAARHLFITQSAVSQRVKHLEALIGQPVLMRTTPPKATAMGQRLHSHWQQVRLLEAGLGIASTPNQLTVRLTVNADSLATWLPEALVLPDHPNVSFDLLVEDQAVGLRRMRQGEVMACLCASAEPVNGGRVAFLGYLRYRAVASPEFIANYGLKDLSRLPDAPCLVFNRDDPLQHEFLATVVGGTPQRIHYCPSSEGFVEATRVGLGYGMIPELQFRDLLASGELVDVVPGYALSTPLYWHYWQTESDVMLNLRTQVIKIAKQRLLAEA
ncbi:LysR family transcriptional regulator ArgP [Salinispirillum marinum]|uniref:LysR family transcriptional regulator ArgP n=2 Tax=Saccharospirillaceae TaxID=255527 RepID=A0ABV8BGE3_9GAMM